MTVQVERIGGFELITAGEAAKRLGVSHPTVVNWVARGLLATAIVAGRRTIIADKLPKVHKVNPTRFLLEYPGGSVLGGDEE